MSHPRTVTTILAERVVHLEEERERLIEKLEQARSENEILTEERDMALLEVDRLRACSE